MWSLDFLQLCLTVLKLFSLIACSKLSLSCERESFWMSVPEMTWRPVPAFPHQDRLQQPCGPPPNRDYAGLEDGWVLDPWMACQTKTKDTFPRRRTGNLLTVYGHQHGRLAFGFVARHGRIHVCLDVEAVPPHPLPVTDQDRVGGSAHCARKPKLWQQTKTFLLFRIYTFDLCL